MWTHSYYDTAAWEKMLQDNLRDCTLTQCNRNNAPKVRLAAIFARLVHLLGVPMPKMLLFLS